MILKIIIVCNLLIPSLEGFASYNTRSGALNRANEGEADGPARTSRRDRNRMAAKTSREEKKLELATLKAKVAELTDLLVAANGVVAETRTENALLRRRLAENRQSGDSTASADAIGTGSSAPKDRCTPPLSPEFFRSLPGWDTSTETEVDPYDHQTEVGPGDQMFNHEDKLALGESVTSDSTLHGFVPIFSP